MRQWIALVAFGTLLAMPCPAPGEDVEEPIGVEPTEVQPGDVLQPAEEEAPEQPARRAQPTDAPPTTNKLPEDLTEDELLDEHLDALRDYEQAETDEEAAKAQKRFEDASEQEMKLRREKLYRVIER
jgi:hypothetical protein